MEELKPCPFCGGNGKVMSREKHFRGWCDNGVKVKSYYAYILCNRCHARGEPIATGYSSEEPANIDGKYRKWFLHYVALAIESWNRRTEQ